MKLEENQYFATWKLVSEWVSPPYFNFVGDSPLSHYLEKY